MMQQLISYISLYYTVLYCTMLYYTLQKTPATVEICEGLD